MTRRPAGLADGGVKNRRGRRGEEVAAGLKNLAEGLRRAGLRWLAVIQIRQDLHPGAATG